MARAQALQGVQLGVETTAGTAVSANKRLLTSYVNLKPAVPVVQHRPAGAKFLTHETVGRHLSRGTIDGQMSYIDLAYWLSSLCNDPGVGASPFTFNITPYAADVPQTYTIETGLQGGAGEKCAYAVVDGLRLRFTQSECTIQGTLFGRAMTDPATLTASPTELSRAPVSPKDWYVSAGATIAGLAELDGVFEVEFDVSNRWGPKFESDSSNSSFMEHVELPVSISATLLMEHSAAAAAYLANMRAMDDLYLRLQAPGPSSMDLRITIPFIFLDDDRSEHEGTRAKTLRLGAKYDGLGGSFQGNAFECVVTNGLSGI